MYRKRYFPQNHYERDELREEERIASAFVLTYVLKVPKDRQTTLNTTRLSTLMQRLGWSAPKFMRITGKSQRGYSRKLDLDI